MDGRCPQNQVVQSTETPENLEAALHEGGLQIWGDVRFRADAVLHGNIHGGVESTGKIIISKDATVSGGVRGSDVRVEGDVQGGVSASDRVWLLSKSKVRVRCSGKSIRIEPGAEFRGELEVG